MIHLFYCRNCMTDGEVQSLQTRFGADGLRMLGLPCSGKMTIPYLLKAFESGADGVVICSCVPTECRNLEGSLRASKRTGAVDALLTEIGLGNGCVLQVTKEQGQIEKLMEQIQCLRSKAGAAPAAPPVMVKTMRRGFGMGGRQETAA